jgi:hypothetical protein
MPQDSAKEHEKSQVIHPYWHERHQAPKKRNPANWVGNIKISHYRLHQ